MFNLTYFQIERTSSNLRGDSILNHISSIFVGKSVQGEPLSVTEDAGDVVEVAQEVHQDDLQISVPDVQDSVEFPLQDQQVPGLRGVQAGNLQLARGVSQDVARVQHAPGLGGVQVAGQQLVRGGS